MAAFEDHETQVVHQMRVNDAIRAAQLIGVQVAAFYKTLLGGQVEQETAEALTRVLLMELVGSCRCECSGDDCD